MLHGISDLVRMIHLYYLLCLFCKLRLAKYRNCNAQVNRNTNVIPITSLYNMLTVMMLHMPNRWKGICGLKPAQAVALSEILLVVQCICWAEPHIHPPRAGLANSDIHTLLMKLGRNIYTTS